MLIVKGIATLFGGREVSFGLKTRVCACVRVCLSCVPETTVGVKVGECVCLRNSVSLVFVCLCVCARGYGVLK